MLSVKNIIQMMQIWEASKRKKRKMKTIEVGDGYSNFC